MAEARDGESHRNLERRPPLTVFQRFRCKVGRRVSDRKLPTMLYREAAELLGIQQSRVSDLVRGKIDRFSIDMLVKLLAKAGRDVEIRVKRRAE